MCYSRHIATKITKYVKETHHQFAFFHIPYCLKIDICGYQLQHDIYRYYIVIDIYRYYDILSIAGYDLCEGDDPMHCLKCFKPLSSSMNCYGMHHDCFSLWFEVSNTTTFTNLIRRRSGSNSDELKEDIISNNNSFYQGKFKKYSANLGKKKFILKMRQDEAPELPEVEYLCNQIALELDIKVARFYIINFEGDLVFVTENFIHPTIQMDLKHIYHFRDRTQHTCRDLINLVKEKTKQPYWVKILVDTILFDALIGNHDRHGRNLAFIIMPNKIILSPIYDNVSYLSLERGNMLKADFNPSGKIATRSSIDPGMRDYVCELRALGFENEIARFCTNLTTRSMGNIEMLIDQSFCSHLMKQALKRLIHKRYEELQNEF